MVQYRHGMLGLDDVTGSTKRSPMGLSDHGDPDHRDHKSGPTPNALGINDHADPDHSFDAGIIAAAGGQAATPDAETFKAAIALYRATPPSRSNEGKQILTLLDDAQRTSKISYGAVSKSTHSSGKIEIESNFRGDVENTSIWLVHEAYHLAIHSEPYIDDELASRETQNELSQYLMDNDVVVNGRTYRLKKMPYLLELKQKEQVIDYIVEMYIGETGFSINKDWILKHKDDWKGFRNRTTNTRMEYAKILVESQPTGTFDPRSIDPNVAIALLELLEADMLDSKTILSHAGEDEAMSVLSKLPSEYAARYKKWEERKAFSRPPPLKKFSR